ncbi:hypothetical protein [Actinomadura bangladeshensis]|uniref:hypothetical protein n=1 Tax=Actinomadura bangladeshensis TaxID=453573 RepID=UPI001A9D8A9F|nr:hypothetical protein [Actinomadura bangladeshensis]
MQPLAEPLPRLAPGGDVAESAGVGGDQAVQGGEQRAPDGARHRREPGRLGERHVAVRQRARQPQHVRDGVGEQVGADRQAGPVDHGAVLPHRDPLGMRAGRAMPGERPQRREVLAAERGGAAGEPQVEPPALLVKAGPEPQDGHPVTGARDQLVVRREHLLVGVPVAAVAGEREQVQRTALQRCGRAARRDRVAQCLPQEARPEVEGVGHIPRKVAEVGVVPHMVADHFPHGRQRPHRDPAHGLVGESGERREGVS